MSKRDFWSTFSYFSYEILDSFQEFLFEPDKVNQISPHDWSNAHFNKKDVDDEQKIEAEKAALQLFTASASLPAVERVFTTYGLVQQYFITK